MTLTDLLLIFSILTGLALLYRLGKVYDQIDSLAEMQGDFLRAILDELRKDKKQ